MYLDNYGVIYSFHRDSSLMGEGYADQGFTL